jgi:UrcA family protein
MRHLLNPKTAVPCALLAILLGPLSACADVAAAPPVYEVATRTVKYGDLDLSHTAGAANLYSRIQTAARAVCEPPLAAGVRGEMLLSRRCMEQSIARAVADVNAPTLTSYHLMKTKHAVMLAHQP